MPFIIGFAIAFLLRPIITKLTEKTNGHEKIWALVTICLFYITIGLAIATLSYQGFQILKDVVFKLPKLYNNYVVPWLQELTRMANFLGIESFETWIDQLFDSLGSIISSASEGLINSLGQVTMSIPSFLISFIFAILSSAFITSDYRKITNFILLQLTDTQKAIVFKTKSFIKTTIGKFIVGYSKIMIITFIELSIGLTILQIHNSIPIAFLIAIFDILPVFGTGGIMIPWICIALLRTNFHLAIGLLIVYIIITIIRNIIEPKIVGKQLGLHPLLMLLCMYLGIRLFGFLGLFLLPATILLIIELNKSEIIHLYKTK